MSAHPIESAASPRAPVAAPEAFDLLALSPAATLLVDADGGLCWANAATRSLLGSLPAGGAPLAGVLALSPSSTALLDEGLTAQDGNLQIETGLARGPRWLRLAARGLPDGGRLLVLTPIDDLKAAEAEAARAAELLDLAQDFGRLGVWERDVHTLEGRWDRHVFRFWGLAGADEAEAPDFQIATRAIVDADRAGVEAAFALSLRQAGTYEHRYRVRAADGSLRRLHSQWTVKNGVDGRPERVLGIVMDDTQTWSLASSHDELQSQLALVVDLVGIATWRRDLATNRMVFSEQAHRMLGLAPRPDGIPGTEVLAMVHPDDLAAVHADTDQALAGTQPVDTEARFRAADGSWRTLMTRRVAQRDAAGRPIGFIGVALDVTGRVDASRRAAELARRFELAARTAGLGTWSLEGPAERAQWSEQLRAMHGLAADAPVPTLAEWLADYVHPDDRADVQRRFADWLKSGHSHLEADFRLLRSDGQLREVITHSSVEGRGQHPLLFGVVVDVTERRGAAMALRQASQRAALAARGAGLGTWELVIKEERSYWDEQMWRLRGLEPQEEPPSPAQRLAIVHPDDRIEVQRRIDESVHDDQPTEYEFRILLPDGRVRWLASRSAPVRDEQGQTVRRIGVNWDITDTRTAEAARRDREIALRESEGKSKFLARMSHELRTPLNAVLGFTQLLLRDEPHDAAALRRRQHLEVIQSAGQHLLSLIDDVLDLTSLEGGELRIALAPVRLAPLVAELLPLLEPLRLRHRLTVHSRVADLLILADATRLRQVLLNLLSNALKYNREGGQVAITAERQGAEVLLRVEDSGRGMSEHQLAHLFEPFNRLGIEREGIDGTGIGLVIVKSLVERMGGSLRVQSTAGVGSVFEVRLSAGTGAAATPGPASASPQPADAVPAAVRGTLLYVEDNPVNARIMIELVARLPGLTLQVATDGRSAIEQAQALRPDLILLDMHLPDFDGFEVLRRLRADARTAPIPCIAVSANAMPVDIQRALAAGVADYWTKPLDFRAVLASIDRLFAPQP